MIRRFLYGAFEVRGLSFVVLAFASASGTAQAAGRGTLAWWLAGIAAALLAYDAYLDWDARR